MGVGKKGAAMSRHNEATELIVGRCAPGSASVLVRFSAAHEYCFRCEVSHCKRKSVSSIPTQMRRWRPVSGLGRIVTPEARPTHLSED
jgi:hypothetical protein